MRRFFQVIGIYLSGLPFFIICFYFITAPPNGQFMLIWHTGNIVLTIAYLIAFPILLMWQPNLRRGHFTMTSLATRSTKLGPASRNQATNPVSPPSSLHLINQQHDDATNLLIFLFERGVLLILAIPLLGILLVIQAIKKMIS